VLMAVRGVTLTAEERKNFKRAWTHTWSAPDTEGLEVIRGAPRIASASWVKEARLDLVEGAGG